jgi:acetyltransferase-like isoleucine patch superfamily enzyme
MSGTWPHQAACRLYAANRGGGQVRIHPTAEVSQDAALWPGVIIWAWSHVREAAELHEDVSVAEHCYIAEGVEVGARSRIGNGVSLWRGVTIGADVFIGPHVCFTNDRHPRVGENWRLERTLIEDGVSIGAGAVILPVHIGLSAVIGAGAVVTKDVRAGELWRGEPARMVERGAPEEASR